MKLNYKIKLLFIFILLIGSIIVSVDYNKYRKDNKIDNNDSIVLSDGDLSINYISGNELNIKNINSSYSMEKTFSVTNTGTTALYYAVSLTDIDYNVLNSDNLKIKLNSTNNGAVVEELVFPSSATEITGLVMIPADTSQRYTLTITYNGEAKSSDYVKSNISVKTRNKETQTFTDIILANNGVNQTATTPGKEAAFTKEGLISGIDDDGTTYYFRGSNDDNYVSFANKMWRIVRINGDGTIRLILNDSINDPVAFNTKTIAEGRNDYYTLADITDSSISSVLKKWYSSNLTSFNGSISESKFCSDTTIGKEDTSISYFNSYIRINTNESPLLNCIGKLTTNNIGLLSVDEYIYAGGYKNTNNTNFYLYNSSIGSNWWLGNPYSLDGEHHVYMFDVNHTNGSLSTGTNITDLRDIRPVISILDTVDVSGNGTINDPYKIQ